MVYLNILCSNMLLDEGGGIGHVAQMLNELISQIVIVDSYGLIIPR